MDCMIACEFWLRNGMLTMLVEGELTAGHARALITALKNEVGLPIHFHTHDTSGIAGATVLAAAEAGVDAVDAAMDAFSGGTSQPCLGSIVEATRNTDRDTGLDIKSIRQISNYWEGVRGQYAAFESGLPAPASEVYLHEMPGGQFTNLKAQARSLGLEERWPEVAQAYADANQMFGDIVKVTPSSKVVGDMALMMVAQGLTRAQVEDPAVDVAFPESVVDMLKGNLGQPHGGWPKGIQAKVLKGEKPLTTRPGTCAPFSAGTCATLMQGAAKAHVWIVWITALIIPGHAGAAVLHYVIKRDRVLPSMFDLNGPDSPGVVGSAPDKGSVA